MAKPKASEGRDTRREILDAALELFADRGLHGTGLRDIARAVGVQQGAVYHHFGSKEELFAAVLQEFMDEAKAEISSVATAPLPDDLAPFFERFLVHALEKFSTLRERKRFRLMIGEGLKLAGDRRLRALEELAPRLEMMRLMERLVRARRLQGDPELLTVELMGPVLVWRMLLDAVPHSRLVSDVRGFARRHVEHFLKATAPAPKPARTKPAVNVRSTRTRRTRS